MKIVLFWFFSISFTGMAMEQTLIRTLIREGSPVRHTIHPPYKEGSFPHYRGVKDILYTFSCKPYKDVQQAPMSSLPPLPPFYLQHGRDWRCLLTDNQTLPLKKINPSKDGRKRILDTQEFPFSFHGHMIMEFGKNYKCVGSGVLIGPHHVLTAGHNLYSHAPIILEESNWAKKVTFIPGHNENKRPFGQAEGATLLLPKTYVHYQDKNHDFGMVILDEPIGYRTGWAGLLCAPDELLKEQEIQITGYPADKGEGSQASTQMWTMGCKPKKIFQEQIEYEVDSYIGQNGAGIWTHFYDHPGYYVIGIHTYAGQETSRGTRFSSKKMDLILSWLNSYQIEKFTHPDLLDMKEVKEKCLYFNFLEMERNKKKNASLGSIDKEQSYLSYKKRAQEGNKEAQYVLGIYYYLGKKFSETNKIDLFWLSNRNNYFYQNSDPKARHYFQKAAEQGHANSQFYLGWMYDNGQGGEQNYHEAVGWYRKAAEQGQADAQCSLGLMYRKGRGGEQNYSEAAKWYRKAAEQGQINAEFNMGLAYERGRGVEQNYSEAAKWYRKAVDQGYAPAQSCLGTMYYDGRGVEQNSNESIHLYQCCEDQGYGLVGVSPWPRYFRLHLNEDGRGEEDDKAVRCKF